MLCNMGQNDKRNNKFKRYDKRKKYPTLINLDELYEITLDFKEFNEDIIELYDDIIEQEDDFFYFNKQ